MSGDSSNFSDSRSSSPKSGRMMRRVGAAVLAVSMGMCIGFDIYRVFDLRGPAHINQSYVKWDALIRAGTAPGRGVFLKFINFQGTAAGFTTNIYFRAVYLLYPRPVVVAESDVAVNKPLQLLAANSLPDERVLRERGVGSILVVDFDPVRQQPFVAGVKWLGP